MLDQESISVETRKQYSSLYVLYCIHYKKVNFFTPKRNDAFLQNILDWLCEKSYISLKEEQNNYELTSVGFGVLEKFLSKYNQFIREFDVFCAVDLQEGEFAFDYIDEFEDETDWQNFINLERWDDLRVAVAEYKGWDVVEIIFLSFIGDEISQITPQVDEHILNLEETWEEIAKIIKFSLRIKSLAYEDNGVLISGENVIKDIISQGSEINDQLKSPTFHS